jgi:hypothetical protein
MGFSIRNKVFNFWFFQNKFLNNNRYIQTLTI